MYDCISWINRNYKNPDIVYSKKVVGFVCGGGSLKENSGKKRKNNI